MKKLLILALLTASLSSAHGQISLLKDVNLASTNKGSDPRNLVVMNGLLFFQADDGVHGQELFVSNGTTGNGKMLLDIYPGNNGSYPGNLVVLNMSGTDVLFFSAGDADHGNELWRTDGTTAGTYLVKDINPGPGQGIYGTNSAIANANGTLYITATDGTTGYEVWKSDGTTNGTVLVKDIHPTGNSYPAYYTYSNGNVFFQAATPANGTELWVTDGTAANTVLLEIAPGSNSSVPYGFTALGNSIYFSATNATYGRELWKSNGVNTTLVKDINPLGDAYVNQIVVLGAKLLFTAADDAAGTDRELWISDGTAAGSSRVADINPGPDGSAIEAMSMVGTTAYFTAYDAVNGYQLWSSQGTAGSTKMAAAINSAGNGINNNLRFVGNGSVYFSLDDGVNGSELWKSDGTVAGTVLLEDINTAPGAASDPTGFVMSGSTVYFTANGGNGREIWKSDGTTTTKLVDLHGGNGDAYSNLNPHFSPGGLMYLRLDDGSTGLELWRSDGTNAGTFLLKDINSGAATSTPLLLGRSGNTMYFGADDGVHGSELWRTDGTQAGTVMMSDYSPNALSTTFTGGVVLGTELIFGAEAYDNLFVYNELYKYNGTSISLIKDINTTALGRSYPSNFTLFQGKVYFTANDGVNGTELWVTDGTTAGTKLILDINPSGDANPALFQVVNNIMYFIADDGANGQQLWKTDGTAAGTTRVWSIGVPSMPMVVYNNSLYFILDDGVHGRELWKSDGTASNTAMVLDMYPGAQSGNPMPFVVGSKLLLYGSDGTNKFWITDGTAVGTTTIASVTTSSRTVIGNRFYAVGTANGVTNLYVTDGRISGTQVIPLPADTSAPDYLNTDGTIGYLTLLGLGTGREFYVLDPTKIFLDPFNQPTALTFSGNTLSGFTVSWTAAADAPAGYLAVRRSGASPTGLPADGTTYTVGATLGDGVVAYVGSALTFNETGLATGTNYYYDIYSYNGSGAGINYYTYVAPLENSTSTLIGAPVATTATLAGQKTFTANWNAATGATSYRLDVSADNFVTFVANYQDRTVATTSEVVAGLTPGLTYSYRVRAVNGGGSSANSNVIVQLLAPADPAPVASAPTVDGFTLTWSPVASADSYTVELATDVTFSKILFTNTTAVSPLILSDSKIISGATLYYIRMRSVNATGSSGNVQVSQLTLPQAPNLLAVADVNVTNNSFKADWDPSIGTITGYELEVSTDNFTTKLTGYGPKAFDISTTEETVTGLVAGTVYQLRVRALNASGYSDYSTVRTVQTLTVTNNPLTVSVTSSGTQVVAGLSGGVSPYQVTVFFKPITAEANVPFQQKALVAGTGGSFSADLAASFDELGVKYFLAVTEANSQVTVKKESNGKLFLLHRSYADNEYTVPLPNFGGQAKDYNMFSIPLDLGVTGSDIGDIFNEILPYDKSQWRLARWESTRYLEYNSGESKIQPGKAYWFNSLDKKSIKTGAGTVVKDTVFQMPLDQGWTMVGNPYPFDITWSDILAYNNVTNGTVGSALKILNSDGSSYVDESILRKDKGGFVFADAATVLQVPAIIKGGIGARKTAQHVWLIEGRNPDAEAWLLPLRLHAGNATHDLSAVGMHPRAALGKDGFDDLTLPRFVNYLEANIRHDDFFVHDFSRDVVPTLGEYTWTLHVETNLAGVATLEWGEGLTPGNATLYLYDAVSGIRVNMREQSSYSFIPEGTPELKIIYSREGRDPLPEQFALGKAYPNPFTSTVTIPFTLAGNTAVHQVVAHLCDVNGRPVRTLIDGTLPNGFHEVSWDGADQQGVRAGAGLYILRLTVDGQSHASKIIMNR